MENRITCDEEDMASVIAPLKDTFSDLGRNTINKKGYPRKGVIALPCNNLKPKTYTFIHWQTHIYIIITSSAIAKCENVGF